MGTETGPEPTAEIGEPSQGPAKSRGEVVVLNGPPGVGKTEVARKLTVLRPGTVCIGGDHLRGFTPRDAKRHLGGGSTYRAAAALASAYLSMGADRVLFDYVFVTPAQVSTFVSSFPGAIPRVHLFTLWATLETVQRREKARGGRSPLGQSVVDCWTEMSANRDSLGEIIDNEGGTSDETAALLSRRIAEGVALVAVEERANGGQRLADE